MAVDSNKLAELFVKNLKRFLGARRPAWLAKNAKLAESTVGRILNGEMKPSFDTIAPLAEALEIHPIEFFADENSKEKRPVKLDDEQLRALKSAFTEMSRTEQLEHPESLVIGARIPKDIIQALAEYTGDWDLIRAVLDIRTPKASKKSSKATS